MPDLSPDQRTLLVGVYEEAKSIGLLGPGPVESHIDHGTVFIEPLRGLSGPVLDLGSGGGVPGLLLALIFDQPFHLLDAMQKRCAFLRTAVAKLGIDDRCFVLEGRAEEIARNDEYREHFAAVTSRSFAPPAVTAECSVGFLQEGGLLVVSEPPSDEDRWPTDGISQLGLERIDSELNVAVMRRTNQLSDRYPRRNGIPEKRPLF